MDISQQLAARQVMVQVQISNLSVPVSSLTMTHEINSLPYVEILLQLDNQDAQETQQGHLGSTTIDLKTFGKLTRLLQEHILNDFSLDTDLQVKVTDGDGNQILFKGYLGKPTFSVQAGRLVLGVTGLHAGAVLQAFNGQIYQAQESYAVPFFFDFFSDSSLAGRQTLNAFTDAGSSLLSGNLGSTVTAATELAKQIAKLAKYPTKTDSIAQRLEVITQGIFERFAIHRDFDTREPLDFSVHRLNKSALPFVKKVLQDSYVSTIIDGISSPLFEDTALHYGLYSTLTGSPNFLTALIAMLPDFLFQMNASWDGKLWLEHLFSHATTEGRLIRTAITNTDAHVTPLFEIPLLQVIVQGAGSEFWAANFISRFQNQAPPATTPQPNGAGPEFNNGDASLRSLARYPEKVDKDSAGMYLVTSAPYWVNVDQFRAQDLILDPPFKDKFTATIAQQRAVRTKLGQMEATRTNILTYLAEFTFKDVYLQKTFASLDMPLNVAVQAGRTYSVQNINGDEVFKGFLAVVRHNVILSQEGAAATTHLDFTHVSAKDTQLDALRTEDGVNQTDVDGLRDLNSTSTSSQA